MKIGRLMIAALIVVILGTFFVFSRFFVDLLWFGSLGLRQIFTTTWLTMLGVFGAVAALSFAILLVNGLIAARSITSATTRRTFRIVGRGAQGLPETIELSLDKLPWRLIVIAVALIVGGLIGLGQTGSWDTLLKYFYATPFGRTDPVFGNDLGFYVFALPFYEVLKDWFLLITFLSIAMAVAVYVARGDIHYQQGGFPTLSNTAMRHLSALLAIFFLVKAGGYLFQRYDLLASNNGIVVGAAYTDVHLRLPLLIGLAGAALIGALLCIFNIWQAGIRLPIAAVAIVFAVSMVHSVIPSLFQSYWVKPDELKLESRYIAKNIEFTRFGFGLEHVASAPFPAKGRLTLGVDCRQSGNGAEYPLVGPPPAVGYLPAIAGNPPLLRLQRYRCRSLWGRWQLPASFARRPGIESSEAAGRRANLDQSALQVYPRQWPRHEPGQSFRSAKGCRSFTSKIFLRCRPPELKIDRPEIYFGEKTSNYVVVGGGTKEFDYAKGQENVYNVYAGRDGVSLSGLWTRALFAWTFGDFKLLISDNVTASSKILFRRLIQDRIQRIAPFLKLDRDPYLVVNEGRLIWLQDAYTVSDALPYSQLSGGINYIRNSVKIAVDAYDGNPTFLYFRPERSDRADLSAYFPDPVSADGIDAGVVTQACSLSGRSFYDPGEGLRHLSHARPRGVLQQGRSMELS